MPTDTAERVRDDELLLTRSFDAPVALVFRLWADAAHLRRWWGPKAFTCTAFDLDFRPGGAWRACIVSERYGESWMSGRYREIEPERRIVFTFTWEAQPDDPGSDTLVTVTFREQDGRTVQTFHQAPFDTVEGRDNHIGGWNECLDREADYARILAAGDRP